MPPEAPADAVRFVHLRVNADVLATRLGARTGHFAPPALLASQLATLETPSVAEHAVELDGERPVPELVAEIERHLARRTG